MEDLGVINLEELRAMRDEMSQMSRLLQSHFEGELLSARSRKLDVRVQVVDSERKPVVIDIRGGISFTARLSYVRASLLVALFVDLRDRCDGGGGVTDLLDAAAEIWATLDPAQGDGAKAAGCLRVALYRVTDFLSEIAPSPSGLTLVLDLGAAQLVARSQDGGVVDKLEIDITSPHLRLLTTLQRIADVSPLNLIRRRKAMFFPMDPAALDRLHLAFFRSAAPLRVRSLSCRLTNWLHPPTLLERTVASPTLRELAQVVAQRLSEGSVLFTEVVKQDRLWDTIRESTKGKFSTLPLGARATEVLEYLDSLANLCREGKGYRLILTEGELPFFVITYELETPGGSECFTLLFRGPLEEDEPACSCFAVYGAQFLEQISAQVLDWTIQRADTLSDSSTVVQMLTRVRERLAAHGPIRGSEPTATWRAPAAGAQRAEHLDFAHARS